MQLITKTRKSLKDLVYLPSLADYILNHRLTEYVEFQIKISRDLNLPLLQSFSKYTEAQLIEYSTRASKQFLTYLSENKADQQISDSIANWLSNRLPNKIDRHDIKAEDITLVSYMRKQSLLQFISGFTGNPSEIIELIREIDLFVLESETQSTSVYLQLLNDKIEDHLHFIEKINNTTPSAIYVFDVGKFEGVYSNNKLREIIGYSQDELNGMGPRAIEKLIHREDREIIKQSMSQLITAKDRETNTYKYRIKTKDGSYKWVRNYESIFKRYPDGKVWQTIGITLDIDKEQKTADALSAREQQLLEAQDIAQIGSYYWDFENNENTTGSHKTFELLEIKNNEFSSFIEKVNAEDIATIENAISKSIETGIYDCEFRVLGKKGEKVIWSRGVIDFNNGKAVGLKGTVMDITERHQILEELSKSDKRYKQAEAITHIGNYTWDLKTNELKWSDELYRIYNLEPGKDIIDIDTLKKFSERNDADIVRQSITAAIDNIESFDFYYKIETKGGAKKILHTRGEVTTDKNGKPAKILGTVQDVTEKQNLISELRLIESTYKQAEELANMGNWTWNLKTNEIKWTDHLYKIYGLDPKKDIITLEKFLSIVHPDDREFVESKIKVIKEEKFLDYSFRIKPEGDCVKTLRSIARLTHNESGEEAIIVGTERDITEKQSLIDRLKKSEVLYKQAQSLALLGNWTYDIITRNFTWSDEMYHIYGVEPGRKLTLDEVNDFMHPDDRDGVIEYFNYCIKNLVPYDKHHRIIVKDNIVKTIHRKGTFVLDPDTNKVIFSGTTQDITERQKLVERLEKSELLYKQAQQISHIGNWSYNFANNKTLWSDEMVFIYELRDAGELTWQNFFDKIHPDDKNNFRKTIELSLKNGRDFEINHRIVLNNGGEKIIVVRGTIEKDKNEAPVQLVGTAQDVTEYYRIEKELRDNQTFIQKITDATPSIIASYNVNTGKYVFISEGIEKLLGYNRNEAIEKGISFFVSITHPDDLQPLLEKNAKTLDEANASPEKNDLVVEFTYRMLHKKGYYRWFHTYGTIFDRNKEGKVEHVLNISLDITDQISATETIKQQEHFIQQIADASPTILYLYDVKSESIVYINREIFFVLGYMPDEIIKAGSSITEFLYYPEDYPLLPERKVSGKKFQQVDSMMQYECRMRNKDGEWRWVLVREIIFKTDEEGNVLQVLGAALDINRRKDMEKTILHNTMLLEQSNASLEEFAYVASHDLKEPLRKISTFGDRLAATQATQLSTEGRLYLDKIIDASQRMQTMISDLLSISMISGNKSFENYSLQKILDETIQTLEYKIEQLNAVINHNDLTEARIIPSQFRQLFQNLISNSLKFARLGVPPVINIQHSYLSDADVTQFQIRQADRYHRLEFSDNGIGFENEYAGKIFAIFQRLHGRSEYEGSGIGLAICKKIVEHHKGTIYAQGVPNEGSKFIIILPV